MKNLKKVFKTAKFDKIVGLSTEVEEKPTSGGSSGSFIKLKLVDSRDVIKNIFFSIFFFITHFNLRKKKLMIFKFNNLRDSDNMASLVDTYCSLGKNVQTIWLRPNDSSSSSSSSLLPNIEQSPSKPLPKQEQQQQQPNLQSDRKSNGPTVSLRASSGASTETKPNNTSQKSRRIKLDSI